MTSLALNSATVTARNEFLAQAGPEDRKLLRTAAFLLLAAALAALAGLLVGLALTVGIAVATAGHHGGFMQSLGLLLDSARQPRSLVSYTYELSVSGVTSFVAAATALALASRIFHRPVRSFLTVASGLRWRTTLSGFALGAGLVGLAFLAERLGSAEAVSAPILTPGAGAADRLVYALAAAAFLFLAALAEEMLFRGWLLQQAVVPGT